MKEWKRETGPVFLRCCAGAGQALHQWEARSGDAGGASKSWAHAQLDRKPTSIALKDGEHGRQPSRKIEMKKLIFQDLNPLLICLIAVLLLHGCSAAAAQPPVTVTAIGYEVFEPVISISWVDNNKLLFAGAKLPPDPKQKPFEGSRIHLWNDTMKTARVYAEGKDFCYSQGKVSIVLRLNNQTRNAVYLEGTFGAEKEIERPFRSDIEVYNKFSCRLQKRDEFVPPLPKTHLNLVLREGDGYVTLRPLDSRERQAFPRNLMLYQAKTGKAIQLPMTWDEDIGGFGTGYSEYQGAYVLPPRLSPGSGITGEWPSGQPRVVYLLWVDGRVERVSIPPSESFAHPRPTRAGWIYGGGHSRTAGLYLFDGKSTSKLDTGGIGRIEVSPDGCTAAVAIKNRQLEMGTPINLKTFGFCSRGK